MNHAEILKLGGPPVAPPSTGRWLSRRDLLGGAAAMLATPMPMVRAELAAPPVTSETDNRLAWVATTFSDVQSAVVVQDGRVVMEFYRSGWQPEQLQDVQSVTKSVLALLFGQALADGHVKGVHELVAMHLPQILRWQGDARLRELRFVHLLTMTAGWPADETARRDRDDDLRQLVGRVFRAPPGTRFAYDNGAANVLALALASAVGERLDRYAARRLFSPLGIDRFEWRRGAAGQAFGALGLLLSPRSMARIGQLVLNRGRWQGQVLVPQDYLEAATSLQQTGGAPLGNAYGYLWWLSPASASRGNLRTAMAHGYGGQWIHVDFAAARVIAVTSRRTPESAARGQGQRLIGRIARDLAK